MTDSASTDSGGDDLYASFEEFNAAMGGGVRDPHQMLADVRAESPLLVGGFADMMAVLGTGLTDGDADLGALIGDDVTGAVALSYDLVQEVLRDGNTFSSALYALFMGPLMGHSILEMDEPEHHRYRGLIQKAFTRKAMERWETELVKPICHGLIDNFAERGNTDLAREYTFWFPINVIAGLLGLPAEDLSRFHRLAVELISGPFMPERGQQASSELRTYFATILDARRAEPADDLISDLAQVEMDGEKLTDEEIFSFLRLLLPAGAETTYRSSGNLLYGLLSNPDQLEAVRADRDPACHRGRHPMGAASHGDHPHLHPRCGARRDAPACRVCGCRTPRRGESRPGALGGTRPIRHLPRPEDARVLRPWPPHLPRHAPGPDGDRRRVGGAARPPPGPSSGSRRPGPSHHGVGLPLADVAAGAIPGLMRLRRPTPCEVEALRSRQSAGCGAGRARTKTTRVRVDGTWRRRAAGRPRRDGQPMLTGARPAVTPPSITNSEPVQ